MQESNKKADESMYPSGHTGVPAEDSLAQDVLAKKVKKRTSPKSPSRKARKRKVNNETFDSTKFRSALVRSIQESNKKGKATRRSSDPSRSGAFRRVGFRSVGILSIIICTILVTSAYASLGPKIVNDDFTNVVNEVLSFTKNKYIQYRFQVERDHSPPIISGLNDLVIEATGTLTIVPLARPTVTDNVDHTPTVINNVPSVGYPLGTNGVIWKARDDAGNIATALQKVTIVDTTPPSMTAPPDVVVEVDSTTYFTQLSLGAAYAKDAVDSSPFVTNDAPIDGFPEGITVVTWTATDASGNSAQDTQLVSVVVHTSASADPGPSYDTTNSSSTESSNSTASSSVSYSFGGGGGGGGGGSGSTSSSDPESVLDITPPSIIPPPFIIANATGPATLVELGWPTVSDTEDPNPLVVNNAPADGFPIGNTTVTWIATDATGNSATAMQLVTVVENTMLGTDIIAPTIIPPPDITAQATGALTFVALDTPTVSDLEDPAPTITNDAPSDGFALGATIITWTATDASGNTASAIQEVRIVDTLPPTIFAPSNIVTKATGLLTSVSLGSPVVIDLVDPAPTFTNDAPAEGFPVGTNIVSWTAKDSTGNLASVNQLVIVVDSAAGGLFNVEDFGAMPDDMTDDTVDIRKAIRAASDAGSGTVYFPAGTYLVDLILDGTNYGPNITLKGDGNAVLKLNPQSSKSLTNQFGMMVLEGPNKPFTNFVIDGLIFDGNKAEQDQSPMETGDRAKKFYALFRVWKNPDLSAAVDHITIKNSIFKNGIAAGIELEGINDVTLENVQLLNNGYTKKLSDGKLQGVADGIYITGSNIVMRNVTAQENGDTNITIEGMENFGTVLVEDCVIGGNSEIGLAIAYNQYSTTLGRAPPHDVIVQNCVIDMENRDLNVYERGTRSLNIDVYGDSTQVPDNIEIRNSIIGSSDSGGIWVKGTNVSIRDNTIGDGKGAAIFIRSGSDLVTIESNVLRNLHNGIEVSGSATIPNAIIRENIFQDVDTPFVRFANIINLLT